MDGAWQGNTGTLSEHFVFDDGHTDQRVWTITYENDQNFTATAGDVVGTALGEQSGNAVVMRYTLRVPFNGASLDLSMEDWMYALDEKTVLNRTAMKKFGITVGTLVLFFRKP
jgi:hypothetical protein